MHEMITNRAEAVRAAWAAWSNGNPEWAAYLAHLEMAAMTTTPLEGDAP